MSGVLPVDGSVLVRPRGCGRGAARTPPAGSARALARPVNLASRARSTYFMTVPCAAAGDNYRGASRAAAGDVQCSCRRRGERQPHRRRCAPLCDYQRGSRAVPARARTRTASHLSANVVGGVLTPAGRHVRAYPTHEEMAAKMERKSALSSNVAAGLRGWRVPLPVWLSRPHARGPTRQPETALAPPRRSTRGGRSRSHAVVTARRPGCETAMGARPLFPES